jgi:hypothetical protein
LNFGIDGYQLSAFAEMRGVFTHLTAKIFRGTTKFFLPFPGWTDDKGQNHKDRPCHSVSEREDIFHTMAGDSTAHASGHWRK